MQGRPVSHACVRLLERDAQWLYDWGDEWKLDSRGWKILATGTPVLIAGHYDFGSPPPWLSPRWLSQTIDLPSPPPVGPQTATARHRPAHSASD